MSSGVVLIVVLLLMLVGVLPSVMPTRHSGGSLEYSPSRGVGFLLIIVLITFLLAGI